MSIENASEPIEFAVVDVRAALDADTAADTDSGVLPAGVCL